MITIMIISEQNDANKQTQQLNKQTKAKPKTKPNIYIYIYTFIKRYTYIKNKIVIAEGQSFTNKMKTLIIMVWSPHNCS